MKKARLNTLSIKDDISAEMLLKYHLVLEINRDMLNKIEIPLFSRNMCLIYLITKFEEYMKKCLRIYLIYRPNIISKEKTLEYETIFLCKTIEDIILKIIEKELDGNFHGGIDDINKYLKKKFEIDLHQLSNFNKFKERFYRRNIIVHNEGICNEIYNKITNMGIVNQPLVTGDQYLNESFILFIEYSDSFRKFIEQKIV